MTCDTSIFIKRKLFFQNRGLFSELVKTAVDLREYLSKRKQRTKVDSFYNPWEAILSEVHQISTPGPLLFNIFMCDMFLILKTTNFTR